METKTVYLDYQATTPVDQRVLDTMWPYFKDRFGNPSSTGHSYGSSAQAAVENARVQIARAIGASSKEVFFTSGGTESNSWVIQQFLGQETVNGPGASKAHYITTSVEHPSVLENFEFLRSQGADVTVLPVDSYGMVSPEIFKSAIKPSTSFASILFANNEVGSLNPIKKCAEIARNNGIFIHSDGVQALGKVVLDVKDLGIDAMSFSAHKLYGPKGVGALYLKEESQSQIGPLIRGGGQERKMRSGTLNVTGIVGMAAAVDLAIKEFRSNIEHYEELRNYLLVGLKGISPELILNGHPTNRLPHNLNILLPGISGSAIMNSTERLALSAGSACSSAKNGGSHVLKAIGLSDDETKCCLRMSVGRMTTLEELKVALSELDRVITALQTEKRSRV